MTASRAPRPIPLSIHAEDLLVAAAIIAALGDRPGRAHLRTLADRLDRCARVCWRQQHPEGDNTVEPVDPRAELLAEELHKLVADFQANGNSRGLGDPTAGAWFEAAQQVLDVIAGWTDTAGSES